MNLKEDLLKIQHSGVHLLGLINELLNLSKIESGKISFHFEYFQIENIKLRIVTDIKDTEKRVLSETYEGIPVEIYISENQLVFTVCRRFLTN